MKPTHSARLAQFALDIRFEQLPASAVHAARRLLLDTLGCSLGALGCEPAKIVRAALSPTGERQASVIGMAERTSVEHAAMLNGIHARYLDFMDVYWAKDVCHPSENIPLALACVEGAGGSGRALIEAIVLGYEAQIRLADTFAFQGMSMHHVSAAGIVAPLVAGKSMGLDCTELANAVALGAMRTLTLRALSNGELSMAKAIGYPLGAMQSLFTTRLAAQGFTGPGRALESLFDEVPSREAPDPGRVLPLGLDRYRIEDVSFKQYPVQFELQTAVEVALRLHRQIGGDCARIEHVDIVVPPVMWKRTADPAKFKPANRETADHSLPCCVAMALLEGRLAIDQFERDFWASEAVRSMIARIRVESSPTLAAKYPTGRPVEMKFTLVDGSSVEAGEATPLGDATRPMDDAAVVRKFMALAERPLGSADAQRVVDLAFAIDAQPDLDALCAVLRKAH
jgi:2-methylcitrate dehydratase